MGLNHIYLTRLRQNQLHGNPNMKNDLFLYHKHPFKMFPYSLECLVRYLINIDEYGICIAYTYIRRVIFNFILQCFWLEQTHLMQSYATSAGMFTIIFLQISTTKAIEKLLGKY